MSSPFAWFFLCFVVIVTIYWNETRRYAIKKKIGLPGPKPLPFIGNVLDIIRAGGIIKFYFECLKKYGKMFVYWGPHLSIAVADPEMRKEITVKHFDNFRDRYVPFVSFDDSKGTSLFAAKAENWKRIRNILTPTFSAAKMKLMVPLMEKVSNTLITKLQSFADSGKSFVTQCKLPRNSSSSILYARTVVETIKALSHIAVFSLACVRNFYLAQN